LPLPCLDFIIENLLRPLQAFILHRNPHYAATWTSPRRFEACASIIPENHEKTEATTAKV
jgi:hypothetical protein